MKRKTEAENKLVKIFWKLLYIQNVQNCFQHRAIKVSVSMSMFLYIASSQGMVSGPATSASSGNLEIQILRLCPRFDEPEGLEWGPASCV